MKGDYGAVSRALHKIVDQLGPVDVLVNNAAVRRDVGPRWEQDPTAWWRTVEINLAGTFNCSYVVLPTMIDRRAGCIINLSSNAGAHRWPFLSPYAVSKAAVIKLTENMALETRRHNESVFAVHPGTVNVGPTKSLLDSEVSQDSPEAKVQSWFAAQIERGEDVPPETAAVWFSERARMPRVDS